MSVDPVPLMAAPGMVIAYLAMCYAGVLLGMDRQLPRGMTLEKWSLIFAIVGAGSFMIATMIAIHSEGADLFTWICMAFVWLLIFVGYYLFQYVGARFTEEMVRATRKLLSALSRTQYRK